MNKPLLINLIFDREELINHMKECELTAYDLLQMGVEIEQLSVEIDEIVGGCTTNQKILCHS